MKKWEGQAAWLPLPLWALCQYFPPPPGALLLTFSDAELRVIFRSNSPGNTYHTYGFQSPVGGGEQIQSYSGRAWGVYMFNAQTRWSWYKLKEHVLFPNSLADPALWGVSPDKIILFPSLFSLFLGGFASPRRSKSWQHWQGHSRHSSEHPGNISNSAFS